MAKFVSVALACLAGLAHAQQVSEVTRSFPHYITTWLLPLFAACSHHQNKITLALHAFKRHSIGIVLHSVLGHNLQSCSARKYYESPFTIPPAECTVAWSAQSLYLMQVADSSFTEWVISILTTKVPFAMDRGSRRLGCSVQEGGRFRQPVDVD